MSSCLCLRMCAYLFLQELTILNRLLQILCPEPAGEEFHCNVCKNPCYRPKRSFGQGYVFTGVCDSVHRGGLARRPPGWMENPSQAGRRTPPAGWRTPPAGWRAPPRLDGEPPPGWMENPPRLEGDSGIRSTIGRYASYWNAFLFIESVDSHTSCFSQLEFVRNSELGKFREKKVKNTFKIFQAYDVMRKSQFYVVYVRKSGIAA